ncbi:ATP-binding protein [Desulfuromonas acetexigens]|uniref:AAA family ATPase n=1 Tax=Trichloromonas acetexigens TaxID=38815 RepID=A0A550J2R1_9BACT|nr:ATP-binding protein [Desulfuromonas acetexigens]TRO77524.1 AAA family ATPase [Desulfuromonas acetexigens]
METTAELKHLLKALRLSPLLSTLPERVAYAKGSKLTHLEFLELLLSDEVERRENVILTGPVGVGKTFIANALAHAACRRGKSVLVLKATKMFKTLYAARADNSLEKELLKLITPSLLVIDDFGLERLSAEQAHDFYEIVSESYERGSTILTSNRHITEWVTLFDDQILANSALDRLAHNAHQMIIEGESYRKKKASTRSLM